MIPVHEVIKLNTGATVLVCKKFPDEVVTGTLRSNIGTHKQFEVEQIRECFAPSSTRHVVVFDKNDFSQIKEISFV